MTKKLRDIVDPLKLIDKRNETARSLAAQAKFTGVDNGKSKLAKDLTDRNLRDIDRLKNEGQVVKFPSKRTPVADVDHSHFKD